MRSVKIEQLGR